MSWFGDSLSSLTGQLSNIAKDVLIVHNRDNIETSETTETSLSTDESDLQRALERIKLLEEQNAAQTTELERLKELKHSLADTADPRYSAVEVKGQADEVLDPLPQDDGSPVRDVNLLEVSKDFRISQLQNEVEVLRQCLSDRHLTNTNIGTARNADEGDVVDKSDEAGSIGSVSITAQENAAVALPVSDDDTAQIVKGNRWAENQARLENKLAEVTTERDSLLESTAENKAQLEMKLAEVTAERDSLAESTAENKTQLEKKLAEITAERDSLLAAVEELDHQNEAAMEQVHLWRERANTASTKLQNQQLLSNDRLHQLEAANTARQQLESRLEDTDEMVAALKTARTELLHQLQQLQGDRGGTADHEGDDDGDGDGLVQSDQLQLARDEIEQLRRQLLEAFSLVEQQQRQQQQMEEHGSLVVELKAHEEKEIIVKSDQVECDGRQSDVSQKEQICKSGEKSEREGEEYHVGIGPDEEHMKISYHYSSEEHGLREIVRHLCRAVLAGSDLSSMIADSNDIFSRLSELSEEEVLAENDRQRVVVLLEAYSQPEALPSITRTTTEIEDMSLDEEQNQTHATNIRSDRERVRRDEDEEEGYDTVFPSISATSLTLPTINESDERLLELQTELERLRKQVAATVQDDRLRGGEGRIREEGEDEETSLEITGLKSRAEELQYERDELHVRVQCLETELAELRAGDQQLSLDGLCATKSDASDLIETTTPSHTRDQQTDSCEMRADFTADCYQQTIHVTSLSRQQQTEPSQLNQQLRHVMLAHTRLCRLIGHIVEQCAAVNTKFDTIDLESLDLNAISEPDYLRSSETNSSGMHSMNESLDTADLKCIGQIFDDIQSVLNENCLSEISSDNVEEEAKEEMKEDSDFVEIISGDEASSKLLSSLSALHQFFIKLLRVFSHLHHRCLSQVNQCQQLRDQLKQQAANHEQLLLECQSAVDQKLTEQLEAERSQLHERLATIEEENRLREAATQRASEAQCDKFEAERNVWRSEREQLMAALSQKHGESVGYHTELQRGFQQLKLVTEQFTAVNTKLADMTERFERLKEEHERCAESERERQRLEQELERLQRHLYETEENYTQEVLRAEQREADLNTQLRSEMSLCMESELATQRIESLQAELSDVTRQRDDVTLQLDDVTNSLTNLQHVLQQFQCDKQRELSAAVSAAKREIDELKEHNSTIQDKLSEANKGLAAAQRLNEQLDRKEDTISALKTEIGKQQERFQKVQIELDDIRSNSSGRVDKSLVRNLVVGWLSAPARQKRDALRILATVLDFSADDRQRVWLDSPSTTTAAGGGSRRSLSSASSAAAATAGGSGGASLSQAFVRFLEAESERVPVQGTSSGSTGSGSSSGSDPAVRSGDEVASKGSGESAGLRVRGGGGDDSGLLADAERMAQETVARLESRIHRPSPVPLSPSPLIAASLATVSPSIATPGHSRQSSVASTNSNNLLMSAVACENSSSANILRTIIGGANENANKKDIDGVSTPDDCIY